jgi:phosphocarrier protein
MKEFSYVITDKDGIHARPAGLFVKQAASFKSKVTINKGNKEVDAKRLFAVMSLAAKQGETITVKVDGEDEDIASETLNRFLAENL